MFEDLVNQNYRVLKAPKRQGVKYGQVPCDSELRITVLARTSSSLAVNSSHTPFSR
jgi:hypothetical protein